MIKGSWQRTSSGTVPGIEGVVDLDQLGQRLTLAQIAVRPAPPPPPT